MFGDYFACSFFLGFFTLMLARALFLIVATRALRYDHWESTAWRYMWTEPTLNPFWNNKIW